MTKKDTTTAKKDTTTAKKSAPAVTMHTPAPAPDTTPAPAPRIDWAVAIQRSEHPAPFRLPIDTPERLALDKALKILAECGELEKAGAEQEAKNALKVYNGSIRSAQTKGMDKCKYLSHLRIFKAKYVQGEDGSYSVTAVPARLSPHGIAKGAGFDPNWKDCFANLAEACGHLYYGESENETSYACEQGSKTKIRNALNACIKAVLGSECGIIARSCDVCAIRDSAKVRDKNANSKFVKVKQELFYWYIMDCIACCATNGKWSIEGK